MSCRRYHWVFVPFICERVCVWKSYKMFTVTLVAAPVDSLDWEINVQILSADLDGAGTQWAKSGRYVLGQWPLWINVPSQFLSENNSTMSNVIAEWTVCISLSRCPGVELSGVDMSACQQITYRLNMALVFWYNLMNGMQKMTLISDPSLIIPIPVLYLHLLEGLTSLLLITSSHEGWCILL